MLSTKNNKIRKVAISVDMAAQLENWRDHQANYAEKYNGLYCNDMQLVFTNSKGGFVDSARFYRRVFRPMAETAEIEGIRFHDIRHYVASYLLSQGVPVKAIADQLGHTSADVTLRIYTSLIAEMSDKLAMALNGIPTGKYNKKEARARPQTPIPLPSCLSP